MRLEEGDLVLCTVLKIVGTSVFVKIEGDGEGTIVVSEIAPGRIRNIRDYVVPNKKIVCKVLRIKEGAVNLSLRRVTQKERKEVLEKFEQEKSAENILKIVLKENSIAIIQKIKHDFNSLKEFLNTAKESSEILGKYLDKEQIRKLLEILCSKKERRVEEKREFKLTTNASDGITIIKRILSEYINVVHYLGSGKYMIRKEGPNFKEVRGYLDAALKEIEKKAKQNKMEFSIIEK